MIELQQLPSDKLFLLLSEFQQDSNPNKINLGIGIFNKENGHAYVHNSIIKASSEIKYVNNNYLPISGDQKYLKNTLNLIFDNVVSENFAMQATCGGTHALSLFAQLALNAKISNIIIPTPTWSNHFQIFSEFKNVQINHLKSKSNCDVDSYIDAIENISSPTILLLHGGSAHNPSGINLSNAKLIELCKAIKEKPIFLLVDFAYFGLVQTTENDKAFIKIINDNLSYFAIAFSYSKCATLYNQRTGALFIKTEKKQIVESNLNNIIRKTISNPPAQGQKTLNIVFEKYFDEWMDEINQMRKSIDNRKLKFVNSMGTEYNYLKQTSGMFSLIDISVQQQEKLKNKYSIYIPESGRINFSGIRLDLFDYMITAMKEVGL